MVALQAATQVGKMAYLSLELRTALALVFMVHVYADLSWAQAYTAVRKIKWAKKVLIHDQMTPAQKKEARRLGTKFIATGGVCTKKRAPRKKLPPITPDEARLAAFILKTGWTEWKSGHSGLYQKHNYFTSLQEAVARSPQLASIYKKFICGPPAKKRRQFMELLYNADEFLRVRARHIKYALSEEEMERRRKRATSLLKRSLLDPTFLERIFFCDECAIIFDHEIRRGVHVYCDAHDKGYRFVIPFKKVNPSQPIKVRIMAVVNYHTGAYFLEFMTGTTCPRRLYNFGEGPDEQRVYKVSKASMSLLANQQRAPVKVHNPTVSQHGC